ncbi:hypothetical protein CYY_006372 [Polysphondylium violaceum]|uniref:Uncharacterized protein n=1 Tax=Polysphondylium violaceum TaxID=133409 RepID=A0A8J4V376_9MYCE|nr:hypothetical protein CYY_006372 [Polysphondylium violaceum]
MFSGSQEDERGTQNNRNNTQYDVDDFSALTRIMNESFRTKNNYNFDDDDDNEFELSDASRNPSSESEDISSDNNQDLSDDDNIYDYRYNFYDDDDNNNNNDNNSDNTTIGESKKRKSPTKSTTTTTTTTTRTTPNKNATISKTKEKKLKKEKEELLFKDTGIVANKVISNIYDVVYQLPRKWPYFNPKISESLYSNSKVLPHNFTEEYLDTLEEHIQLLWNSMQPKDNNGNTIALTPNIMTTLVLSSSEFVTSLMDHLFYQYDKSFQLNQNNNNNNNSNSNINNNNSNNNSVNNEINLVNVIESCKSIKLPLGIIEESINTINTFVPKDKMLSIPSLLYPELEKQRHKDQLTKHTEKLKWEAEGVFSSADLELPPPKKKESKATNQEGDQSAQEEEDKEPEKVVIKTTDPALEPAITGSGQSLYKQVHYEYKLQLLRDLLPEWKVDGVDGEIYYFPPMGDRNPMKALSKALAFDFKNISGQDPKTIPKIVKEYKEKIKEHTKSLYDNSYMKNYLRERKEKKKKEKESKNKEKKYD